MTANNPNGGPSENSVPITTDDALEAISNHRRRFAIRWVDESQVPARVDHVADQLASIENEPPIDAQDRKRVYIALCQTHLDKLDELGALAYHERSKTLMPSGSTHALADLIRYVESICERGV